MTQQEIESLIDMARARGVTHFKVIPGGGVEFILGPAPAEVVKPAPSRKRKDDGPKLTPEQVEEERLFGPLGIRKRGDR